MENIQKTVQLLVNMVLSDDSLSAKDQAAALKALRTLSAERPFNVRSRVEEILTDIGVPSNLSGYNYLVTAICLVIDDPDLRYKVTTCLYPKVASVCHGRRRCQTQELTASCVERCIRHAIERGCDLGDPDALIRYFGNSVSPNRGKPTNSQFICQIANCVWREMRR